VNSSEPLFSPSQLCGSNPGVQPLSLCCSSVYLLLGCVLYTSRLTVTEVRLILTI
jgi:hypothetical protein